MSIEQPNAAADAEQDLLIRQRACRKDLSDSRKLALFDDLVTALAGTLHYAPHTGPAKEYDQILTEALDLQGETL